MYRFPLSITSARSWEHYCLPTQTLQVISSFIIRRCVQTEQTTKECEWHGSCEHTLQSHTHQRSKVISGSESKSESSDAWGTILWHQGLQIWSTTCNTSALAPIHSQAQCYYLNKILYLDEKQLDSNRISRKEDSHNNNSINKLGKN